MKNTLEYIVKLIVDKPDEVSISESEVEDTTVFSISVSPEDMGKVIGKNGKIIHAIRNIMKVAAIKEQKRIRVELLESKS